MGSSLSTKTNDVILPNNVILSNDVIFYIGNKMDSIRDLSNWIIAMCLKRDGKGKVFLSSLLSKPFEKCKYDIRSRQKRYVRIQNYYNTLVKYNVNRDKEGTLSYCDETKIHELPKEFYPLLLFINVKSSISIMSYVEDSNNLLNGKFSIMMNYPYDIIGCFKDSKIIGNVYLRRETFASILPMNDPSLFDLRINKIYSTLKRLERKAEGHKPLTFTYEYYTDNVVFKD